MIGLGRCVVRLPRHFTHIRFGKEFQTTADDFGAQEVAFFCVEFLLRCFLQMGRLRFDKELVDRETPFFGECTEVYTEFHDGK